VINPPTIQRPFYEPFIARHFPAMYERREVARLGAIEASYRGGVPNRTSEEWTRADGLRFGTAGDRIQVQDTRSRAYQAYENDPVARTLVQTETDNVIGDGLNYQPTSSSEEWNREAKDRYYAWLEECSVRGPDVETGCELQRTLWSYSRVGGDIGWILVSRGSESRVQTIRAENIATPDDMHSGDAVYDGIRFDGFGRPTTFYVLTTDDRQGRRVFTPIPARDFVWLPHMTNPGQARPPSCYVTIFEALSHLRRFVNGVSLAAWMATVFGLVIKQKSSNNQFAQLGTTTNSQGDQQRAITLENGSVKYAGTEDEVAQVQASQPMQQTPAFIDAMYRIIGQPFDMPLEVIAKNLSTVNFASARIGLIPFQNSCRIKAGRFGSRWSRTTRWWLSRERLRASDDPRRWTTPFPADYWNHEFLPNAFDYTDPVSEAQSDLLQIDMKTKSPQMVIAERGRDEAQIIRDLQAWETKTKDLPKVNSTLTRHPQTGVGATGDPLGREQIEPPAKETNNAPE
jgi:capsid protein